MKDSKWRDEDIEDLLAQAPKVEDHRSKEDVLKRLQQEGVFNTAPKKKKQPIWLYGVATAAITAIAVSGIYVSNQSSQDEAAYSNDAASTSMEQSSEEVSDVAESEWESKFMMAESMILRTAVYPEDVIESIPFTIGLAGDDAESVPVTFLLSQQEVMDVVGTQPTKLELYEYYAPLIDEQALGFAEYHPLKGTFSEDHQQLQHKLPANHAYDSASATMAMYTGMLIDTFSRDYTEVILLDEAGEPITFSQVGEPSEPLLLQSHYSYFLDEQPIGMLLAPNFRKSFANLKEALQYMKVEENDVYQSAILEHVDFTVQQGAVTTVTFIEPLDLEKYDAQHVMWMIEAMLLTAAGFDQQIQFENIVQTEWQGFDFSVALPKPIGANWLSNEYLQKN